MGRGEIGSKWRKKFQNSLSDTVKCKSFLKTEHYFDESTFLYDLVQNEIINNNSFKVKSNLNFNRLYLFPC